jgi:hypothetical protein
VSIDRSNLGGWRAAVESTFPQLRTRPEYMDAELFDRLLSALVQYRGDNAAASATR